MGDLGIDKWWWRMEEHRLKGHRVAHARAIPGPALLLEKPSGDHARAAQRAFNAKTARIKYWDRHHEVPTPEQLFWGRATVET